MKTKRHLRKTRPGAAVIRFPNWRKTHSELLNLSHFPHIRSEKIEFQGRSRSLGNLLLGAPDSDHMLLPRSPALFDHATAKAEQTTPIGSKSNITVGGEKILPFLPSVEASPFPPGMAVIKAPLFFLFHA